MNPTKAIEILKSEQKHGVIANMDDWNDAIKLGIEAIERLLHARSFNNDWAIMPLPSESRD